MVKGLGFMSEIWCRFHVLEHVLVLPLYPSQYFCIMGFILWEVESWWDLVQVHGIWVNGESIPGGIGFKSVLVWS